MPGPVKKILAATAWLALYGIAWTAGMAYIITVNTRDEAKRWREWVTA